MEPNYSDYKMKCAPEDISKLYSAAPDELRFALSSILTSTAHMCITEDLEAGLLVNWRAGPAQSIQMLVALAASGKEDYGRLWLEDLQEQISQIP